MAALPQPEGDSVDLNGATPVTIVASPAPGVRRVVLNVLVYNRDSAAVTPTVQTNEGGTRREYSRRSGLAAQAPWPVVTRDAPIVLDSSRLLEAVLSGAAATTNPVVHVTYLDITL